MNDLLNIFSNLAFPVALVVVLLYAYKSIISKYISYLQSQNQKLTEIISRNNELFEKIYNFFTNI